MDSVQVVRPSPTGEKRRWLGGAVVSGIVVFGLWLAMDTVINGPGVWAQLDQRHAGEREQEDIVFCGKFGMSPGSEAFAACADELAHVRRLEAARAYRRAHFF